MSDPLSASGFFPDISPVSGFARIGSAVRSRFDPDMGWISTSAPAPLGTQADGAALRRALPLIGGLLSALAAGVATPTRAQTEPPVAYGPQEAGPDAGKQEAPDEEARRRGWLPLWAGLATDRGIELPATFGLGVVAVAARQSVLGDELSIRLARDEPPPPEDGLLGVPSAIVGLDGESHGVQIKADAWLFPFLNVFVAVGQIEGDIDVRARLDIDEFLPPLICRPIAMCGVQEIGFTTPLSTVTTTFGGTAVYGGETWFTALTGAHTVSVGGNRTDVKISSLGLRGGPRVPLDNGVVLEPYLGVSYLDADTRVTGVARARSLLPGGSDLVARYDLHVRNRENYSIAFGVNAQFGRYWDVLGEYSRGGDDERLLLSLTRRF